MQMYLDLLDLFLLTKLELLNQLAHVLNLFLLELVVLQVHVLGLYLAVEREKDVLGLCQVRLSKLITQLDHVLILFL